MHGGRGVVGVGGVVCFEYFRCVSHLFCAYVCLSGLCAQCSPPSWPGLSQFSLASVAFGRNTSFFMALCRQRLSPEPSGPCFCMSLGAIDSGTALLTSHQKWKLAQGPGNPNPAYFLLLFWSLFTFAGERAEGFFVAPTPLKGFMAQQKLHVCLALPVGWRRAVMKVTCPDLDYFCRHFNAPEFKRLWNSSCLRCKLY